ncbi:Dihydroneopterin triphosphate 2'-epimerase [Sinobacterium norvegicum]|uniref:Dihydroneopterin triphosphate 2'-epimerase n=1 Tax=Sinobacterium norvegicum TaxID=1641715 RepID=A0ABM9AEE2_9GAMM|nr:dihydroneopterin triphosphate 2'-epimerase [Sinobacterium norvegicum]CAH0991570.1 Dihydroneopterin triphosphate 2'-epimerase [Sinobacterium norvegicum]
MTQLNPLTTHPIDYQMNAAVIHISNLRLRTFIGFNPEELSKQQDIIINAEIHYSADEACDSDDENRALNYKLVCKSLIEHVENGRFRLLEKLVADLLAIIMAAKQVEYASIRVDKPHALRFADSVSLSLSANR